MQGEGSRTAKARTTAITQRMDGYVEAVLAIIKGTADREFKDVRVDGLILEDLDAEQVAVAAILTVVTVVVGETEHRTGLLKHDANGSRHQLRRIQGSAELLQELGGQVLSLVVGIDALDLDGLALGRRPPFWRRRLGADGRLHAGVQNRQYAIEIDDFDLARTAAP